MRILKQKLGFGSNVIAFRGQGHGAARFALNNEVEAYWEGLRNGGSLPGRAQIDPRGLSRALHHTFILERIAPRVARFRVAGQQIAELMGMSVNGMPISAIVLPNARDDLAGYLEELYDGPCGFRIEIGSPSGIGRPGLKGEMLLLPLRDTQGNVSRALGSLVIEGRVGHVPRRLELGRATRLPVDAPEHDPAFAEAPEAFEQAPRPERTETPVLRLVPKTSQD